MKYEHLSKKNLKKLKSNKLYLLDRKINSYIKSLKKEYICKSYKYAKENNLDFGVLRSFFNIIFEKENFNHLINGYTLVAYLSSKDVEYIDDHYFEYLIEEYGFNLQTYYNIFKSAHNEINVSLV